MSGGSCVKDYVDPCAGVSCGANSYCSGGSCYCNSGYSMSGGSCVKDYVDPCAGVSCGANSYCSGGSCYWQFRIFHERRNCEGYVTCAVTDGRRYCRRVMYVVGSEG